MHKRVPPGGFGLSAKLEHLLLVGEEGLLLQPVLTFLCLSRDMHFVAFSSSLSVVFLYRLQAKEGFLVFLLGAESIVYLGLMEI